MADYYTLGAQLPTLKQGDYRNHQLTSREFVELLKGQSTKSDSKLIDLLLLREDNALLLQILNGEEAIASKHRMYVLGEEKLRFLVDATQQRLEAERNAITEFQELEYPRIPKHVYPRYMEEFVERFLNEQFQGETQPFFYADLLLMSYADYVQSKGNEFLRRWFKVEQDIAATLSAITADKFKLDKSLYILGDSPLYELLKSGDWSEITYLPEGELVSAMRRIADEENLAVREQKIDDYKWKLLDEETFADIFSINAMLVYLLKLQILERWEKLDKVQGEQQFREIVSSLNKDFKQEMDDFKKSLKSRAIGKSVSKPQGTNE